MRKGGGKRVNADGFRPVSAGEQHVATRPTLSWVPRPSFLVPCEDHGTTDLGRTKYQAQSTKDHVVRGSGATRPCWSGRHRSEAQQNRPPKGGHYVRRERTSYGWR